MKSTESIKGFPLILPKGKNGCSVSGTNWQQARSPIEYTNAKISNTPPDASTMRSIYRGMIHACEHFPYRIRGYLGSSTFNNPDCKREYAVFQRDGWICIYTDACHFHKPCIFECGINPDVKMILLDHKHSSRPVCEAIRYLQVLQRDPVRKNE
jgi:hypothetical protein